MSPERLLQHFERIADAPDAVPRMRRFILDLAVRGKLVEQDPKDEPAAELLEKIQAEILRLVRSGEIRKGKELPSVERSEVPFNVPAGWKWVRVRHVTGNRGQTIPDRDFTYIDVTAINKEVGCIADAKVLAASDAPSRARKLVCKGDVLYSCVRPYLLNVAIVEDYLDPAPIASTAFAILTGFGLVLPKYLWVTLRSPFMVECVEAKMRGQAYPAINDSDFALLPLPLPPLAEQHRIVSKVDELMGLCDELEAAQAKRESRRDRLVAATLHGLNNGESETETGRSFPETARFYFNHLPRLTTRPEHIQQLRQTILNLAVRGRLVPQDPNDEPAGDLLKRVQVARRARTKKALSPSPLFDDETVPFPVPPGWRWTYQGELVLDADAGWSPETEGFPRSGVNWGVLKVSAVSWDRFLPEENKQLLPGVNPPASAQVHAGDFLISRANTSELVAKCVVVEEEPQNLILSDKIVRLQIAEECSKRFFTFINNHAEYARSYYAKEASGTSLSMKNVSRPVIYALPVPVPPVKEQKRIVAKVDELMALCDELETHLTETTTTRRQLLEATLAEALASGTE